MADIFGRIHSYESFGAVDGPGVRFVVFLQGCLLRCLYCHNPDTLDCNKGELVSSDQLMAKILSYKSFISDGGVTLSGGEPLLQPEFCEEIIDKCHENNLHITIDTSGAVPLSSAKNAMLKADLILLDIKDIESKDCKTLTGLGNENALATLNFCEKNNKNVWIRHVLVPGYTMIDEKLHALGKHLKSFCCIKKVELLPYHKLGLFKWEQLGLKSKLEGIEPPPENDIKKAKEILLSYGLKL